MSDRCIALGDDRGHLTDDGRATACGLTVHAAPGLDAMARAHRIPNRCRDCYARPEVPAMAPAAAPPPRPQAPPSAPAPAPASKSRRRSPGSVARNRRRRSELRAETLAAAELFVPGRDPAGSAPLLEDGTVDVRAQLARWDAWANQGTATSPSATGVRS